MQVTAESRQTRWRILLTTWSLCALLVVLHTLAACGHVVLLGAQGLRGVSKATTPLRQVIPAGYADAQMWVRHAVAGEDKLPFRVRHTHADNAPTGREVHWSSSVVWILRIAQQVQEVFTPDRGAHALERSVLWLNAPLLIGLMVLLSAWAAERAGAGAGVLVACGMVGHPRFYDGFLPANVDHHGLINASMLGLLLGLLGMGAGWWKTERPGRHSARPGSSNQARHSAIVSAGSGAIGLWLSAASVVPMLALAGGAGLLTTLWHGRTATREGAHFEPAIWQLWGRVGAILSLVFYLLEYAPSNLGLRLEVNHPLYALAWWGGGETIALLARWRLARDDTPPPPLPCLPLAAALLAVAAAPLVILIGGRSVFLVSDPIVGGLWRFVAEGMSLPMVAASSGLWFVVYDLLSALVLIPAIIIWKKQPGHSGILPGTLIAITAVTVGLAVLQTRWFQSASAAQIALLVALFAAGRATSPSRQWQRIVLVTGVCFLLLLVIQIVHERSETRRGAVRASDLVQPLYRDVAAALRKNQPGGEIVVLASPNATAGICYFGNFSGLGTLYWENADGLRAAGEVLTSRSDDEALRLIRLRCVTHVVMISRGNFIGEYFRLLYPELPLEEGHKTFGYRLGTGLGLPPWLRPVPYEIPPELKDASPIVRLFAVARE
ncbi:MAG: hypothetical protein EXS37_00960 [Opitutus sp.]|nr:hypothetical protein [Opitutus sp.]